MKKYKNYIIAIIIVLLFCISTCFVPINATRLIPIVQKITEQELGVKVHIDKLIFRFGPSLKIKAPILHLLYEDGTKFAQLDNVKFYVPWSTLIKDDIFVNKIYANNLIVKINSQDSKLDSLIKKMQNVEYEKYPNLKIKNYNFEYKLNENNEIYEANGTNLELAKINKYKNIKVKTDGKFLINKQQYITYNISVTPNIEPNYQNISYSSIKDFTEQIKNLDFHADLFADIKIYNNMENIKQVSGLINIDNISVLDRSKKYPKSFIYLTFLGNKTGIFSNIYASSDKKIYAEGVINNSKKPEIDLKVKTDDIKLADIYKKIKLVVDCSKYKGIDILEGNMTADFNIKGDLNKIKSTGYMKISNAEIKANGINIKKINSDIDFSNNTINITNALGYVNNAPIMLKGDLSKELNLHILMDKIKLKDILPDSYGIENGIISLNAVFTGTLKKITHKENIKIENFKATYKKNSYSFNKLDINTNKDNIAYVTNIIIKPQKTEEIKFPLLKLIIENDKIKIPNTNIFMKNSKMIAKGEICDFNTNNYIYNFDFDGFVNSKDIGITKVSSNYPVKLNINGNSNQHNIDSNIQVIKATMFDEPVIVNLNATLENESLKIEDLSINSLTENTLKNKKLNIKDSKKIILTGNIENIKNPNLKNIRIYVPQLLNININDTITQLKGDLFINGKINEPVITGQLFIQNLINQFMQISLNNATIDFNKNTAIINAPVIKIADSSAGINATCSTNFTDGLKIKNLNIKSKFINTDSIIMYKDLPISNTPIEIENGKIYAERTAISIYGSHLYMTALNSDLSLKNNNLSLKNISSDLFNGKFAGNLNYNLKDDSYYADIQARGVSASPIIDVLTTKKDFVSGTMDFDSIISGNIISKQTLDGKIKFIIHNGHMGTLGKLEHLIYAQNVIADSMLRTSLSVITKAITLKDTGLFKYLRGDITLKNGIANIDMLQSQGPLMSLYIKGEYNPMIDYAKLIVLGRISDEITSCLGAFGEFSFNKLMIMLTGEENKLNIKASDIDMLPQLPSRNTKEFRSVINGFVEKPSSVITFNWISYTQKSLKQKDVPITNEKVPDFIDALPY